VAMPRTLRETVTRVQPVEVPGPERIVRVKEVVVKEVPVEVVRMRMVVKRVPTWAPRPVPTLVAETPTTAPATPALTLTGAYTTGEPTVGTGIGARRSGSVYGVSFASYPASSVTSSDLRLLASRLRTDMSTVDDDALGTSTLAATLAADMGRAGAEMDRALSAEPAAGTDDR